MNRGWILMADEGWVRSAFAAMPVWIGAALSLLVWALLCVAWGCL